MAGLALSVARASSPGDSVERRIETWEERNREGLARARATLNEIAATETGDLATLSVALRVLRNLVAQGRG